jgi:predicted lipid-binding transport protein (Tim44 family)
MARKLSHSGFDTITVRINANAADDDVNAAGSVVNGHAGPRDWTEDWIFQRPSTAVTGRPGTITSHTSDIAMLR